MNGSQRARLEAVEAAIATDRRALELAYRSSRLMTNAECVESLHGLCHVRLPSMRAEDLSLDDPEIEATVVEARRLIAESYGR